MPVRLSYINARNEEIILDDDENSFAHELVGREGCEMPKIKTETVTYGDGSQDIVFSRMEPRTVTCYFWVDLDDKIEFERHLRNVKAKMMQVGARDGNWGKLKIRQKDGTYVYLNCIYKEGFDALVRDSDVRLKFALSFEATDPLFYNGYESKYIIQAPDDAEYLLMISINDVVYSGGSYDFSKDNISDNPTGLYMRALTDTVNDDSEHNPNALYMKSASGSSDNELELECQKIYPTIKITGNAGNIRIYNELTGKKIEIDSAVIVDGSQYVLLETKPLHRKAVLVNVMTGEETNIMHYLTADSTLDFPLERGTNVITYRNTDVTPESKCTFSYTEGWLEAV